MHIFKPVRGLPCVQPSVKSIGAGSGVCVCVGGVPPVCTELPFCGDKPIPGKRCGGRAPTQDSVSLQGCPTLFLCRQLPLLSQSGTLLASFHCPHTELQLMGGYPLD